VDAIAGPAAERLQLVVVSPLRRTVQTAVGVSVPPRVFLATRSPLVNFLFLFFSHERKRTRHTSVRPSLAFTLRVFV
jgi:hypothetical protein